MEDWSFCLHKDYTADDSSSFCMSSPSMFGEAYLNEYSPLFSSFSSPLMNEYSLPPACNSGQSEVIATARDDEIESEVFYNKYSERMGWFDVLNHDRTCGLGAILNKEVGIPSSLESIRVKDFSIPYISWNKVDKKQLLKSFQSDFELVYVGQSCLTWEALHHQYRKVKFLTFSNCLFPKNVAVEFQNFQVWLERFLEEERYIYQGTRVWNYAQARFASKTKTLLQVPKVSGFLEEEKEGNEGETVHAKEVLKAIDKCMKTFGNFITADRKKPWWKFKTSLLWTYPPVEDPKDLELLAELTRKLQKKELWLKDLQGKQKCWFNKAVNRPSEESQKEAVFFTLIEMKLISRVLQMPILSSSQLNWCQEKLDNIVFRRGRLLRTASGPLFPPS
ncbi:Ribosomal protein L34Ae [Corchorus olitorius]|uniref:Ribosomal protein L34Ae n=1 Tax=Corchorus olitorius TaxID=93759 RepID=A0A1R3KSC6_9ROSI|nr:Ribosomal protein L34Ae [Corchorus olitorius]